MPEWEQFAFGAIVGLLFLLNFFNLMAVRYLNKFADDQLAINESNLRTLEILHGRIKELDSEKRNA